MRPPWCNLPPASFYFSAAQEQCENRIFQVFLMNMFKEAQTLEFSPMAMLEQKTYYVFPRAKWCPHSPSLACVGANCKF